MALSFTGGFMAGVANYVKQSVNTVTGYDPSIAQGDASNYAPEWDAPEPYAPSYHENTYFGDPYIEQQDYSNWGAPPVLFEDMSVGPAEYFKNIYPPNPYAYQQPAYLDFSTAQEDMSNWYTPSGLSQMVPDGYASPNVLDYRIPEPLDIGADPSWLTNNYMPPPVEQMDQSNWAMEAPLDLNPGYTYIPPVYQPAPVDQGDQSNWYEPYQPPDNAEYVQGYEPAGLGEFGVGNAFDVPGDVWGMLKEYNRVVEERGRNFLNEENPSFWDQLTGGGAGRIQIATGNDVNELPYGAGTLIDQTLSPASLLTAGAGGSLGAGIRAALPGMTGRAAANLVEPVVGGGFAARLGGEAAINAGATGGAELANAYLPENMPFRDAAVMAAGFLGGGAAVAGAGGAGLKPYRPNVLSMADDAGVPRVTPDVNPEFRAASDAVLEAVRKESNLRRIGIPEREIAEGRVQQVSGIMGALDEGRAAGLGGEELALAARSGAATGPLRQTFTEPIVLEPMQRAALFDEMSRMLEAGEMRGFEYLTATKATQKLLAGEGLQPAEIRLLRNVFGEEVAQAAASRPQTSAQMRRAELREIEQGRALEQKLLERKQREATQAIQRANREAFNAQVTKDSRELRAAEQARLKAVREGTAPPVTTSRELDRLMDTRERALKVSNDADAAEIAAGRKLQDNINARAAKAEAARANREAFNAQVTKDSRELRAQGRAMEQAIRDFDKAPIGAPTSGRAFDRMMQTREAAIRGVNEVDQLEIAQGRRLLDEIAERQARTEVRGAQAENLRGLRAAERADRLNPNTEMLVRKAEELIGQSWPAKESLRQEGVQTIRHWLEQNDVLLDAIGKDGEQQMLGTIRAQLRGDTANSFVTALLHRKNLLVTALEHQGWEREIANKAATQLARAELVKRYRDAIPAEVEALLKAANEPPSRIAGGLADLSQEFKNTMFGLDIGVLGIQVSAALGTGNIPMLAGIINKTLSALHLPHVNTMYADIGLPKMTQYELDGVPQNMLTGIASDFEKSGTLLRQIPLGGAWADRKFVSPALEALQLLQFKSVMTPLRNTIYEGNLVLAHLARQDVMDPRVRATAAESAAAITSAGKLSPIVKRATAEKGTLLSPSMSRAQVQFVSQIARVFNPKATATERIVGATAIASSVTGVLFVGQYLNDLFGVDEFEIDPSKPGFGNITLPSGTVINIFPQKQVVRAFAQSIRVLAETDPKTAEESWQSFLGGAARDAAEPLGKMVLGRLATGPAIAAKAAGFGYQPGEGYKLGDYGGDVKGRILNLAPIPPVIAKYLQGEVTGESIGWDITGFNNYQESDYTARDRALKADPDFGRPFKDLDSGEQDDAIKKYGDVEFKEEPIDAETKFDVGLAQKNRANKAAEAELSRQLARGIEGEDLLDAVKAFKTARATAWDVAMGGDPEKYLREHKDEPETVREGYAEMYYAVDMPLTADGEPDFDAFYKERDRILAKAKRAGVDTEYITGRGDGTFRGEQFEDPAVAEAVDEYEQFQAAVRESGYWDLKETAWAQVSGLPGVNPGESYDDFRERLIEITKEGLIASGYPPETAWQEAAERSSSVKALTSFNDDVYKPHFLYPWVAENPQVAFDLQKWGYYNPDAEMEALLQSYWEQGIVK